MFRAIRKLMGLAGGDALQVSESLPGPDPNPHITITRLAAEKVKEIAEQQGLSGDWGLRLGIDHQPDGGFTYVIAVVPKSSRETDYWFTSNGIAVVVDYDDARYLQGTVIDYKIEEAGSGFAFDNPNALRVHE